MKTGSRMATESVSPAAAEAPQQASFLTRFLLEPWRRMLAHKGVPTLQYLAKTEAHTFAFSVAANAILSFFPFMVMMMWLIRNVFHSQSMETVVIALLRDHLPAGQDLVINNLKALVKSRQGVKLASILILLVSSTGVFLPLEVAMNQIWGFTKNRSYLGNQIVSLALAFSCGFLALGSVGMAAENREILSILLLGHEDIFVFKAIMTIALKLFATVASVAIFFLIYRFLPNGKVRSKDVLPAAAGMGILWEVAKYVYIKALPWLDFHDVYGPFSISITLMFWAFLSGLMLLAGAHLASEFSPNRTAEVQTKP
jgi:YihY family inner membrane protein